MLRPADPSDRSKFVVGHFLPGSGLGGAEVYATMLAEARFKEGLPVKVIVFDREGPLSERIHPQIPALYLGYRRASIRNPFRFIASVVRGYLTLEKAVAEEEIQVLQTHLANTHFWGLILTLRKRCRVVFTIHNNNFLPLKGGTRLGAMIKKQAFRLIMKRGAAVVAISEEVKVSILETLGFAEGDVPPIEVVTNGVEIPEPLPGEEINSLRSSYGVKENEFLVLAAGRLTEAKNFQCLLHAVGLLRDRGVQLRVVIGGEGHLRGDLEQQIADLDLTDRVRLPGNIRELGDLMQAADLLAMPSRWEGLPLVLLEAMARGLPVVGTRINGLSDVVTEERHGLLVDVDDAEGLAKAIERLAGDSGLREGMGRRCLKLVREKYSFDRVYAQLDEIYQKAAR